MSLQKKKKKGNISETQKHIDSVLQSLRDENEKINQLKITLKEETRKLNSVKKMCDWHQASLLSENSTIWHGTSPDATEFASLVQLMKKDLAETEKYTDCIITQCVVTTLNQTEETVGKQYEATGKVEDIHFKLLLQSEQQVQSCIERVVRVADVQFTPPLEPLRRCLIDTNGAYIMLRAITTLKSLEREVDTVRKWSASRDDLEIVSQHHSLVISHVPSTVDSSDSGIVLKWKIIFSEIIKNFKHNFTLSVSLDVLARYSRSPMFPVLNEDKPLQTETDVIDLFSAFS